MASEKLDRIAIINPNLCKPKKCGLQCKKSCPVNKIGKLCVEVTKTSQIASIAESLCCGAGMCVKACPFSAIKIINLPKGLEKDLVHRYSVNSFKLHRLPIPRLGHVLGLIGANGSGKTTILKILAGKLTPNFGNFSSQATNSDIIDRFKGSELQSYFSKLYTTSHDKLTVSIKPQHVEHLKNNGIVKDILKSSRFIEELELTPLLDRKVSDLSGGELQRFCIAYACSKPAQVYIFDEPTSYLDVRHRIQVAKVIRSLCLEDTYVIVVDHDLSILDYLSDYVCCLYGSPAAYGVVTQPMNVRDGINIFLEGYIPSENVRFRDTAFTFRIPELDEIEINKSHHSLTYPKVKKVRGTFTLTIDEGKFSTSNVVVLLGQNGTGKTTFIKMLAGKSAPCEFPKLNVSYKPQILEVKCTGTVRELFFTKIKSAFLDSQFNTDVIKPLKLDEIIDHDLSTLSGGEIQRVAIILCLGKPADIYLLDEPSAYLDSEQRIIVSRILKRFVMHTKKTAFVVEHDFSMATYLADQVIVFSGIPSVECVAHSPQKILDGMNVFLKELDITFRRDKYNYRPRINKTDSIKDRKAKSSGKYFD